MIIIDGNDGTGKSTLVEALKAQGIEAVDRGLPTKMTDDPVLAPPLGDENRYVIIDVPVTVSRERLAKVGKDLSEKYHTVEDLTHYRTQFLLVAFRLLRQLGPQQVQLIDGTRTASEILADVVAFART